MNCYEEIPLYNKDGLVGHTKVDKDDFEKFGKIRWNIQKGYVACSNKGRLHRLIINAKEGEIVDHVNNDKLDNRKCNLRIATHSQNGQNKTKKQGTISNLLQKF